MKKMKPSVKAVLAPTLVLASTAAIAYAFPDAASEKATDNQANLKLDVERVDSDTVKVSIDNIQDIPRSLQFSIKLDGVTLQNGQNSIRDLVEKEVTVRQQQNNSTNQVLTDYTYNEADNTIDILITSTESLPKVGNKIEVFELDVKKSTDDETNTYKVIPAEDSEYKYVTNTSKEYSTTNADYESVEILLAAKPTIKVDERYTTVVDGETLTVEQLKEALGLELAHEDGADNLALEITRDGKVIENFSELTPGVYQLSLCAVKDGTLKSDAITVEVGVTLDTNVTDAPIIKKDNLELVDQITLEAGEAFSPTENVTATDAKGRNVEVSVKADKDLDLDPDQDTDYTLTYTATDIYGNKAEKVVILTVIANQAPTIEGVTDITIKVGDKFDPKAGIKVTDDKDENPTLTISGEVNTKLPGKYKLSYTVTDSRGKSTVVHRTVTVEPAPEVPETPGTPETPAPETPAPEVPETPETPETPAPEVPETPEAPDAPAPEVPETPETPETPAPEVPETPETPETPAPEVPETPETPGYIIPDSIESLIDIKVVSVLEGKGTKDEPLALQILESIQVANLKTMIESFVGYDVIVEKSNQRSISYAITLTNDVETHYLTMSVSETQSDVIAYLDSLVVSPPESIIPGTDTDSSGTTTTPETPGAGITPEKPQSGSTINKPSTGHTAILGYIGLTVTVIGGFLFNKKKKNR